MATSPAISIDRPPSQPPSVMSQMGGAPPIDVAGAMAQSAAPGGANQAPTGPKAQVISTADSIRQLVQVYAGLDPALPPYVDKIMTILDASQAAALNASPGAGASPQTSPSDMTAGASTPNSPPPVSGHTPTPFPG